MPARRPATTARRCNAEGDDDECKYHVKWTATAIRAKSSVDFEVTLTKLADMTPATGAASAPRSS